MGNGGHLHHRIQETYARTLKGQKVDSMATNINYKQSQNNLLAQYLRWSLCLPGTEFQVLEGKRRLRYWSMSVA